MGRYDEQPAKRIAQADQDAITDALAHLVLFIAEVAGASPTDLAAGIDQNVFANQYLCVLTEIRTPGLN
ncbi:hypothetical protein [Streptomyces sp. NPDC001914]|uniref:hypothetical protein n=1 Tax=Streptomyces sp. NPDC001914 TaxID=3364623 RepID=UPI0036BF1388